MRDLALLWHWLWAPHSPFSDQRHSANYYPIWQDHECLNCCIIAAELSEFEKAIILSDGTSRRSRAKRTREEWIQCAMSAAEHRTQKVRYVPSTCQIRSCRRQRASNQRGWYGTLVSHGLAASEIRRYARDAYCAYAVHRSAECREQCAAREDWRLIWWANLEDAEHE